MIFLLRPLKKLISFLLVPGSSQFLFGNDRHDDFKNKTVDYVIIPPFFVNTCDDVHKLLIDIRALCHDRTRIIFILNIFGSRFSPKDIWNFLIVGNYDLITRGRFHFFRYFIARPLFFQQPDTTVSVIVPIRNEKKNIASIIQRVPSLGSDTEIVFVEGGSTDGTREECERLIQTSDRKCKLILQSGDGKGNAVKEAIYAASHDVIVILDADLVIPPEELIYFYETLLSGEAEFLNSSRLVYPMEPGAMPLLNRLGNRFFGWLYSWLLGEKLKDLFGGTKMFRKSDYIKIDRLRPYFQSGDQWGDVDMFFGAAKLYLKLQDVPVHYYARLHGISHMRRYSYAWFLVKAFLRGYRKLKPGLF
ncbi:glycosyltransferase family 2 protein [Candidatus Peregrinibacteria bacterium]|nr:glycosyltransferase family 2 protein [Candidatus Peregrinibacteria bacterium]